MKLFMCLLLFVVCLLGHLRVCLFVCLFVCLLACEVANPDGS